MYANPDQELIHSFDRILFSGLHPHDTDAGDVAPEAVPAPGVVVEAVVPKAFGVVFPNGARAGGGVQRG